MKIDFLKNIIDKNFEFEEIVKDFPVIQSLKEVPQNPVYHAEGDVYCHTKMVLGELLLLPDWRKQALEKKAFLYLAALFHDIGKLLATREEEGVIISPKHAVKGAKMFRELCYTEFSKKFNIDFYIREQLAGMIRYHGLPVLFMEKQNIEYTLLRAAECVSMRLLAILATADVLGRKSEETESYVNEKKQRCQQVGLFCDYTKELLCYDGPREFSNLYTRFVFFNGSENWYGNELFDSTQFTVYLMSGFPLSGKDTYIGGHKKELPVVSLDEIREKLDIVPGEPQGRVVTAAIEQAKEYLRRKESFIWNATNLMRDIRRKLCGSFSAYGARVVFLYVEAPYEELLARNKVRERSVPEEVINRMIRKFDMLEPWEGYQVQYIISK